MTSAAFDTDAAAARLMDVGQAVIADANYRREWESVSVVAELDGRESIFGYMYFSDGKWRAEIPKSTDDFLDKVLALRQAMADKDGRVWKACRVSITRPDLNLTTDFEYDDVNRWHVTPGSLEEKVEELRPK